MDKVLLARFARQALTFIGGVLVTKGIITDAQASNLIDALITGAGAAMTIGSLAWSVYRHFRPSTAMVVHTITASNKAAA